MAVISLSSIVIGNAASRTDIVVAGSATLDNGDIIYRDSASNYEADLADVGALTTSKAWGVLIEAGTNFTVASKVNVLRSGRINTGLSLSLGDLYYVSGTAGDICLFSDLVAGDYVVEFGRVVDATASASEIEVDIRNTGILLV